MNICVNFGTIREVQDPESCIRDECYYFKLCTGKDPDIEFVKRVKYLMKNKPKSFRE